MASFYCRSCSRSRYRDYSSRSLCNQQDNPNQHLPGLTQNQRGHGSLCPIWSMLLDG
ncbi:unnamed protein product [Moneuplotes crassus]|uniref:Uncharacterized protein n=1 Tax=Euplotes crassus TaxID=5936 RepID=A0AAD1XYS9_EUPCR|nr:unnamed protein product [Moneuplotes crassus]